MSCTSLSNDSVPSALLQTDVLSDCAYCDQALSLPICAVQCARSAPYVSVILKHALKGKSSVSTQDSKNFCPAGLDFWSNTHSILFYFVGVGLNVILSLTKDEVCSSDLLCLCLWLAVLHAPLTKVWSPSAAEVKKITHWSPPPNAAREHFVGKFFVHCGYTLLLLFLTSHFHSHIFTILKLCNVKKKRSVFDSTFEPHKPPPHPIFSLFIHTVDVRFSAFSILTNVSFRENEILTYVRFRAFFERRC